MPIKIWHFSFKLSSEDSTCHNSSVTCSILKVKSFWLKGFIIKKQLILTKQNAWIWLVWLFDYLSKVLLLFCMCGCQDCMRSSILSHLQKAQNIQQLNILGLYSRSALTLSFKITLTLKVSLNQGKFLIGTLTVAQYLLWQLSVKILPFKMVMLRQKYFFFNWILVLLFSKSLYVGK